MKKSPIIIHYGCMASEKSLALIQDYRKSRSVDEVCLCYVYSKSKDSDFITSRFMEGEGNGLGEIKIPAKGVKNSKKLYQNVESIIKKNYDLAKKNGIVLARFRINVLIDEMQLFDEGIKEVVENIAYNGVRVVGAGLDLDFRGEPFPLSGEKHITLPDIMGIASERHRHYARCAHIMEDGAACGNNATRSQRFRDTKHEQPSHYDDDTVEVNLKKYMPVCEEHHVVPGKHNKIIK